MDSSFTAHRTPEGLDIGGKPRYDPPMETAPTDPALQALAQEVADVASEPIPSEFYTSSRNIQRVKYSHDALIDLMISHPEMNQNAIAAYFGRSAGWISNIICADAFQAAYHTRREQVIDPVLKGELEQMFKGMVHRSLVVLQEKLSKPVDQISDTVALKAVELGAKAIGIGGNAPPVAPPQDRLVVLSERLLRLGGGAPQVIEGEITVKEVSNG